MSSTIERCKHVMMIDMLTIVLLVVDVQITDLLQELTRKLIVLDLIYVAILHLLNAANNASAQEVVINVI